MNLPESSVKGGSDKLNSMRVTTDFFAAALLRQLRALGGFAYLVRRGAHEAGALFILHHHQGGKVDLYGPAPQSLYLNEAAPDERLFIRLQCQAEIQEAQMRLEKELDFDPDIWLIEIENFEADLTQMIKLVEG